MSRRLNKLTDVRILSSRWASDAELNIEVCRRAVATSGYDVNG